MENVFHELWKIYHELWKISTNYGKDKLKYFPQLVNENFP